MPSWGPAERGFGDRSIPQAAAFLVATFALSVVIYAVVIAADRGWIGLRLPPETGALVVVVPGAVAVALRTLDAGRDGLRRLLDQSLRWNFRRSWWLATILLPPTVVGASYGAYVLSGGTQHVTSSVTMLRESGSVAPIVVPIIVLITVLLAYTEEVGWRGYLLPRLQTRFSALGSSLILGVVWGGWQLPLIAFPGSDAPGFPVWVWGIAIMSLAVVYTWLFNVTGGSVLAVTLFHAGLTVWSRMVALQPSETGDPLSSMFIAGGYAGLAIVVILAFGWRTLAGHGSDSRRVLPEAADT